MMPRIRHVIFVMLCIYIYITRLKTICMYEIILIVYNEVLHKNCIE